MRGYALPGALIRLALAGLLAATLAACTAEEVGRSVYNSGKNYCATNPHDCGQGDTGKPNVDM